MNRLFQILRYRWRTVVVILAVTMVAALWITNLRNDSIEPQFRAEAPVTFVDSLEELEVLGGSLVETVESQLEEAHLRALEINEDLLETPGYAIEADSSIGRLTFIASGATAAEAASGATEMRDRVLEERPFNIDQEINRQIDATLNQLDSVRTEITRVSEETELDPAVEEERTRLSALHTELEARALQLEQWTRVPPTGEDAPTPQEVSAELDQVNQAIADVEADLAELAPSVDPLSQGATELRALQRQYEELEVRYQNLLIQRSDLQSLPLAGDIETVEQTPSTVSTEMAAGVALVLGLALAFAVLVITERLAAPVWLPSDVAEIPFLPRVTARQRGGRAWYLRSGSSGRKAAIQAIRSSIRARVGSEEFVVAVAGSGIASTDVQLLAVDLASSFSSTSADTALMDASFDATWHAPEFRQAEFSLSDAVVGVETDDQVHSLVDSAAAHHGNSHEPMAISTGEGMAVPADALAGPRVSHLFDVLRETEDVVVVACDDIEMPSTHAVLDRSDVVLLVTRPGATRRATLVGFSEEMSFRQIDLVATFVRTPLLLALRQPGLGLRERMRRRRGRLGVDQYVDRSAVPVPATTRPEQTGLKSAAEPMIADDDREHAEDGADSVTSGILSEMPDEERQVRSERPALSAVVSISPDASGRGMQAAELFSLLNDTAPSRVVSEVEEFMVDAVTRLVLAEDGSGLDPTTVAEVSEAGFIPLSTWKGNPSLGSRLRHEFRTELGKKEASEFEDLILQALASGGDASDATSLDRWVSRRYFELHAAAEDWAPRVWHILSHKGTLSALVSAERFDRKRMEAFVDSVVIRAIERLSRRRRRKELVGDRPAMEELDAQIEDARELGLAIAWLIEGSRPESRLWYPSLNQDQQPSGWAPDWSYGIKSNLAPLQRLGILSTPVLTEGELQTFEPTA